MILLLYIALFIALYRVASNHSYLSGRDEMRKRYAPNHGPDPYEVGLRSENKRLLCAAASFGAAIVFLLLT